MTGPERATRLRRALLCLLGVALGMIWWTLDTSTTLPMNITPIDLVLFAVAAAVLELLPIRQAGARSVPTSLAVVGTAAMLGAAPAVVALVAACGWAIAATISRSEMSAGALLSRASGGWALAGLAAIGAALGPATWHGSVASGAVPAALNPGAAIAVGIGIVVGVPMVETLVRFEPPRRFLLRRMGEALVGHWLIGLAVASTAVLGTLVHPVLGQWTLPTMLIPLFAARVGLDRYGVAARAYDQTVRAMSRLPEQLATVEAGHGIRVAEMARAVTLDLGLDAATVADVERACYLHELGRIKLERDAPVGRRELAQAGASVIHEAASMDRVARIIEAHGDPAATDVNDPEVGRPARIVAACCEIDRYAPDRTAPGQRHEVVVRLVREVGDLDVVRSITRVLDRRDRAAGNRLPVG